MYVLKSTSFHYHYFNTKNAKCKICDVRLGRADKIANKRAYARNNACFLSGVYIVSELIIFLLFSGRRFFGAIFRLYLCT